jgi:hypothetical protein
MQSIPNRVVAAKIRVIALVFAAPRPAPTLKKDIPKSPSFND